MGSSKHPSSVPSGESTLSVGEQIERLRLLPQLHTDTSIEELARGLRTASEHPGRRATVTGAPGPMVPRARELPEDLVDLVASKRPDAQALPRTPRHSSTSAEGTLGTETDSVVYFEYQHATWSKLCNLQLELVRDRCCSEYARGRTEIAPLTQSLPSLRELDLWLQRTTSWRVVRADGYVEPSNFMGYLARKQFPCMDLLRHHDEVLYSPAPDMFHDAIGHLPMLCNDWFSEYYRVFGSAGLNLRDPLGISA